MSEKLRLRECQLLNAVSFVFMQSRIAMWKWKPNTAVT